VIPARIVIGKSISEEEELINTRTVGGRWAIRGIAALIVLAGALAAVVSTTDGARAGGCDPIRDPYTGEIVGWDCPPYQELVINPDPPCWCPYEVDWNLSERVYPETVLEVHDRLASGIGLLSIGPQPPLEQEALAHLTAAAAKLGPARLTVSAVYDVDSKTGVLRPIPQPPYELLWSFGSEVADGMALLQAALADPDKAEQLRGQALAAFERGIEAARHA
jgi:hypothetical protein